MATTSKPLGPPAPAGAPPKPPSPRPRNGNGADPNPAENLSCGVTRGIIQGGERIGIYGPGGIGKTELVANLADVGKEVMFIDLDQGTFGLDVARGMVGGNLASTFEEVRAILHDRDTIEPYDVLALDTFSVFEDRIREWVIQHVPHEKGKSIQRIEDYGYGKGYTHIFEAALLVLQDLDALCRRGKHVILVCHQCAEKVPSAETEDYLEYQPRLQSPPKTGKLRERIFEWCNHFFRIDYDRFVEDGKVVEGDVRSIRTTRTTTAWAKHRTLSNGRELPDVIPFAKGDSTLWQYLFGKE